MAKKAKVADDLTTLKIRWFTDIPQNHVLVGENRFTKNPKVYSKAMFHIPGVFRCRVISLATQNADLKPVNFELGSDGMEVVADIGVSYKVKGIGEGTRKMGFKERWQSVIDGFRVNPIKSGIKTALLTAGTVAAGIFLTPISFAVIPAVTAGYISMFHQDKEWVKKQGAYKAVYNAQAMQQQLEQTVYDGLRSFYASRSYQEVKGRSVDLSSPDFAELRRQLEEFEEEFGIKVTKVNIKTADLTEGSNKLLQQKREAENARYAAEQKTEARKKEQEITLAYIEELRAKGLSNEEIKAILLASSGANMTFIQGGGIPAIAVGGGTPGPDTPDPRTR